MSRSAVVLGHVAIDEVSLADGTRLPEMPGGAGSYAALGQALVAPGSVLVSGVGTDFPEAFHGVLTRADVDTRGLVALDARTPRTRIQYFDNGEREESPVFGLDHFARLDPTLAMLPSDIAVSALYVFDQLNPALFAAIDDLRRDTGCSVLWEIHADICTEDELVAVRQQASGVDIVSLNRTEALGLSGTDDFTRTVEVLRAIAPVVALRLGADGAAVIMGDKVIRATPPPGVVVDPTGAGNAFSGAFVASWDRSSGDPEAALRDAMAASALTIRQYGPPPVDDTLRAEASHMATTINVTTQ